MYNCLLVAFDGSEQSFKALIHAVTIAEKFGSELKIVTVVPNQMSRMYLLDRIYNVNVLLDIHDGMIPIYKNILANAEAKVRSEHPDVNVTAILMEGRPSVKIVEVADKEGCDLIIMGYRRLGSILYFLEECTSRSVMNNSKIPVMIIT